MEPYDRFIFRYESAEIKRGKALGLIERIDFDMTRDRVEAIDEKLVELEKRFNEVDREFRILIGTGPSIKPVPKSEPVQVTQVEAPKTSTPPSPKKKIPPPVPEKKSSAKITPLSPRKSATQKTPPPPERSTTEIKSLTKSSSETPTEALESEAPQPSKRTTSLAPTQKPTKRDLDSDDHDTYYDDHTTFR